MKRSPAPSVCFGLAIILFLPAIARANSYSGKVTDLSNRPLTGVDISLQVAGANTSTDATGAWSLSSGTTNVGLDPKVSATSITRHLVLDGNRLRLRFDGVDGAGRTSHAAAGAIHAMAARREVASDTDTIVVQWKRKYLVRLPVSKDLTGIIVAIDTAWSSDMGIAFNPRITYGSLTDSRDGQVYRTVKIGSQTWMAQNLNHRNSTGSSDTVGACYDNNADLCSKYGSLYTWPEVMNGSSSRDATGICPTGWHVPIYEEWLKLDQTLGTSTAGNQLKSTSGWNDSGDGTDALGFRLLPAGSRSDDGQFIVVGSIAYFWTSSVSGTSSADYWSCAGILASMLSNSYNKTYGLSLRCLRD